MYVNMEQYEIFPQLSLLPLLIWTTGPADPAQVALQQKSGDGKIWNWSAT